MDAIAFSAIKTPVWLPSPRLLPMSSIHVGLFALFHDGLLFIISDQATRLAAAAGSPPQRHRRSSSRNFDFDLFWFGFFALGQMHPEHAILELRVHFVGVGVVRDNEASLEAAVGALDAMILLVLLFLLGLAFTRDGQHAILDGDFYVLFFHFGQLGLDEVFLLVLGDVH